MANGATVVTDGPLPRPKRWWAATLLDTEDPDVAPQLGAALPGSRVGDH